MSLHEEIRTPTRTEGWPWEPKMVINTPRREASAEASPAHTVISHFSLHNCGNTNFYGSVTAAPANSCTPPPACLPAPSPCSQRGCRALGADSTGILGRMYVLRQNLAHSLSAGDAPQPSGRLDTHPTAQLGLRGPLWARGKHTQDKARLDDSAGERTHEPR